MTNRCRLHAVPNCPESRCRAERDREDPGMLSSSNAGTISLTSDGGVAIGIGSGLAIDPSDGSLGVQFGNFTVDMN